jgi:ParB-like chromosome segregation protein Spo0J
MHPDAKQNLAALDWRPVDSLKKWAKNPKKHGAANLAAITASIEAFGFVAPVVIWGSQSRIIAGHGRIAAALGIMRADPARLLAPDAPGPGVVPVRVVEFSSEAQAAAYALADNRLTEMEPMQAVDVAEVLRQIQEDGGDLSIPGWTDSEIAAMLDASLPGADDWGDALRQLPTEDRAPIRVVSFTLHDEQAETVQRAVDRAKGMGDFVDTGNENSNGNAIARVCEMFLSGPGR